MLGLSMREILVKMVKDAVDNQLPNYKEAVEKFYDRHTSKELQDISKKIELADEVSRFRVEYVKSVYNTVREAVEAKYGDAAMPLDQMLLSLRIAGLYGSLDPAILESNEIYAGIIYLLLLYSLKIEPIKEKDYRKSTELNEYQTRAIRNAQYRVAERWMI